MEEKNLNSKVIIFDAGYYIHTAIFSTLNNPMQSSYTFLNMLLSDLKKLYCNDDWVYLAIDKGHSWRKTVDGAYKQGRKKQREAIKSIDWDKEYKEINYIIDKINIYSPLLCLSEWGLEADDWVSYICRYFNAKNVECLIVATDSDFDMLFALPKINIFSPKRKEFKTPISNPYQLLEKKIKKERVDGLVAKITTDKQYDDRKKIVNLLELPEDIENIMKKQFTEEKIFYIPELIENIPFKKLQEKWEYIFNKANNN